MIHVADRKRAANRRRQYERTREHYDFVDQALSVTSGSRRGKAVGP
jgi:hypothetical protein